MYNNFAEKNIFVYFMTISLLFRRIATASFIINAVYTKCLQRKSTPA